MDTKYSLGGFHLCTLLVVASVVANPASVFGDDSDWERLVRDNSESVALAEGSLKGLGAERLLDSVSRARFIAVGEEHLIDEAPLVVKALHEHVWEETGACYLATENGPFTMKALGSQGLLGDREATLSWLEEHPMGLAFCTPAEIDLLLSVGQLWSEEGLEGQPLWGLDQPTGASHVLEALKDTCSEATLPSLEDVLRAVRAKEDQRFELGGSPRSTFMASYLASPRALDELASLHFLLEGQNREGLEALHESSELYHCFRRAQAGERQAVWENGSRREALMKTNFLEAFRRAKGDQEEPHVVVKGGAWHLGRGLNANQVASLGSFLAALARMEEGESFHLAILSPQIPGVDGFSLTQEPLGDGEWWYVDLRALRGHVPPSLAESTKRWVSEYDAMIVVITPHRSLIGVR